MVPNPATLNYSVTSYYAEGSYGEPILFTALSAQGNYLFTRLNWGGRSGDPTRLFLFYMNVLVMVLLVLPAFDNTISLGTPPHQVVYPLG